MIYLRIQVLILTVKTHSFKLVHTDYDLKYVKYTWIPSDIFFMKVCFVLIFIAIIWLSILADNIYIHVKRFRTAGTTNYGILVVLVVVVSISGLERALRFKTADWWHLYSALFS